MQKDSFSHVFINIITLSDFRNSDNVYLMFAWILVYWTNVFKENSNANFFMLTAFSIRIKMFWCQEMKIVRKKYQSLYKKTDVKFLILFNVRHWKNSSKGKYTKCRV